MNSAPTMGKIRLFNEKELLVVEVAAEGYSDEWGFHPIVDAVVKDGKVYIQVPESDFASNEYLERPALFVAPVDPGPPILHDLAKRIKKLEATAHPPIDLKPAIQEIMAGYRFEMCKVRALIYIEQGLLEKAYQTMANYLLAHVPRCQVVISDGAFKVQAGGKEPLRAWVDDIELDDDGGVAIEVSATIMRDQIKTGAIACPCGNHPIFVRADNSIVAHYGEERGHRCAASEQKIDPNTGKLAQ